MSMVWPCPLTAGAYASAGRAVKVPWPECPSCSGPVVSWSGYWRHSKYRPLVPVLRELILRPDTPLDSDVKHMIARQLYSAEDRSAVICEDRDANRTQG